MLEIHWNSSIEEQQFQFRAHELPRCTAAFWQRRYARRLWCGRGAVSLRSEAAANNLPAIV
jgi:hypothetical protein